MMILCESVLGYPKQRAGVPDGDRLCDSGPQFVMLFRFEKSAQFPLSLRV